VVFAKALPAIRATTDRDLRRRGLPRERVLAAVVRLLELTLIRVGNDEYARANRSYGLATLRRRHVTVTTSSVRFRFTGKSRRAHEIVVRDRRLARVVRDCLDLGRREVFAWRTSDGELVDVSATEVNDYLRAIAPVTSKDFRTWAGTVLAWRALRASGRAPSQRETQRVVVAAVRATADRLGNTPAVARGSYIHPVVIEAYESDRLPRRAPADDSPPVAPGGLAPSEEAAVAKLIRKP
jgi:DNA topoisomerase-1